jgi:hypothetical protein
MDFYKDIICNHKFINGFKKGQICLKYNCINHDEYNCNLGWYLGLPANFCFFSKKILNKSISFDWKTKIFNKLIVINSNI